MIKTKPLKGKDYRRKAMARSMARRAREDKLIENGDMDERHPTPTYPPNLTNHQRHLMRQEMRKDNARRQRDSNNS